MKKLLLSGLALSVCFATFAQNRVSTQARLSTTITSKVAKLQKPSEVYAVPLTNINPVVGIQKNSLVETTIGTTSYDLQANYGTTGQRIHLWSDNTISAIWTTADGFAVSPPERGTGYSYFNGTSWNTNVGRIETFKTGFPSLGGSDALGEVIVNHGSNASLAAACTTSSNLIKRQTKGTGAWMEQPLSCASVIWWPRVAVGGSAGTTIHALGNDNAPTSLVNYSRSTDGGTTWTDDNITLPDFTTDIFEGPVDGYQIATRGDVVAIVMGGQLEDLILWKSTDNGSNWTKTTVNEFPLSPYDYAASGAISDVDSDGIADTVFTTDNGMAMVLDLNGNVHISVGLMRVLDDDTTTGGTTSYFPGTDGLLYWNESMPTGDITNNIIASIEDIDGSLAIELPPGLALYQSSLTGMPTLGIDDQNQIHLAYSSIIENTTNGNSNPDLEEAYRNIYTTYSTDGGMTWNLPSRIEPTDFDEQVWPSMTQRVNNSIHIVYHKDGEPGNSYQPSTSGAGTVADPFTAVDVIYNTIPNPVGINENTANGVSTSIYPNPVASVLNVDYTLTQSQTITVKLVDLLGQTVYSNEIKGTTGVNNVRINVKNYAAGIYTLNTITGDKVSAEKVVIR